MLQLKVGEIENQDRSSCEKVRNVKDEKHTPVSHDARHLAACSLYTLYLSNFDVQEQMWVCEDLVCSYAGCSMKLKLCWMHYILLWLGLPLIYHSDYCTVPVMKVDPQTQEWEFSRLSLPPNFN
jgi:hypothetical protein